MPDDGDKQTQKIAEKTRRVLTGAAISEQRIRDLLSHGELGEMGEEEKRDREEVAKAEIEENDPVNAVTRAAKNLEMTRHNLSMGAALNVPENAADFIRTTAGGQPLTSAALTMAAKQLHLIQQGKKDKEQTHKRLIHQIEELNARLAEIRQEIKALEDRNALLREQIDENNLNIAKETAKIAAANSLMERLESGESPESIKADSSYKKMAEAYRKETGKDPDKLDPKEILLWQINHSEAEIKGLNEANTIKEQEIEENADKIKKLEQLEVEYEHQKENALKIQDPQKRLETISEINRNLKNVRKENRQLRAEDRTNRNERVAIQSHEGVQDRAEREWQMETVGEFIDEDEEVGNFMKEYAETQKTENEIDRLRREQDLVAGLSPNAVEQLSFTEETEHLFKEGYFAKLDSAQEETVIQLAQTPAGPGQSFDQG